LAIRRFNERVPVWNSNSLVEYFLESVLKHRRAMADSFQATMADRAAFAAELAELDLVDQVYPSAANFLLVRLKMTPAEFRTLRQTLLCRWNLFVKDCSSRFHDTQANARVAVRLPEENARLVKAIRAETSLLNRTMPTPAARAA
jgi:histidinol-phosphate/aromatic aminotransferase/cobyric acid decarboxylase-like protein